jgi:hypothetical protein
MRRHRLGSGVSSLVLCAAAAVGCGGDSGGTYARLTFSGTVSPAPIASIAVTATLAQRSATTSFAAPSGGFITLPTTSVLEIGSGEGTLDVVASALAIDGTVLGTGAGSGTVVKGKTVDIVVVFAVALADAGTDAPGIDGPRPLDSGTDQTKIEVGVRDVGLPDGSLDGATPDVPGTGGVIGPDAPMTGGAPGTGGIVTDGGGGSGGSGGTDGGGSDSVKTFLLTVNPPGLDFGVIVPGSSSPPQTLTVANTGDAPTPALAVTVSDSKNFTRSSDLCTGVSLRPGANCTVTFVFNPTVSGVIQGEGSVAAPGGAPATFKLTGAGGGAKPELLLTPTAPDFKLVDVGKTVTLEFTVRNIGTADAGKVTVQIGGPTTYKIVKDGCGGAVLPGQGQCLFVVSFTPVALGASTATVTAQSSLGLTASTTVSGTGRDYVTVTVLFAGTGTGSVSGPGLSCSSGAACAVGIPRTDPNAMVTLSATPAGGSSFGGWAGPGTTCSGSGTCSVSLASPPTVTATFTLIVYNVKVGKTGNGSGTITSSPGVINCGTVCNDDFPQGQTVTLTATPAAGSSFKSWSGGCTGTTPTCVLSMNGPYSVSANFVLNQYTLTVTKDGAGAGTVASSPGGIACGATCAAAYDYKTTVVLTATPLNGSTFAYWTGGGCTGSSPCSVAMTSATTVNATFKSPLTCGLVSTASSCTNGSMTNVMIQDITAAECQKQCQAALIANGQTSGCWVLSSTNNTCYCRNGVLATGGSAYGGSCGS